MVAWLDFATWLADSWRYTADNSAAIFSNWRTADEYREAVQREFDKLFDTLEAKFDTTSSSGELAPDEAVEMARRLEDVEQHLQQSFAEVVHGVGDLSALERKARNELSDIEQKRREKIQKAKERHEKIIDQQGMVK